VFRKISGVNKKLSYSVSLLVIIYKEISFKVGVRLVG